MKTHFIQCGVSCTIRETTMDESCAMDYQCDGLITDSFVIDTPHSGGRQQHDMQQESPLAQALTSHCTRSPFLTPMRRTVLGRIENSPLQRQSIGKISQLVEDRRKFGMDKENVLSRQSPLRPVRRILGEPSCTQTSFKSASFKTNHQTENTHISMQNTSFLSQSTSLRTRNTFLRTEIPGCSSESSLSSSEESYNFFSEKSEFYKAMEMRKKEDVLLHTPIGHELRKMTSLTSWTVAQVSVDSPERHGTPVKLIEEVSSDSGYPPSGHKPLSPLIHDDTTVDFDLNHCSVPGIEAESDTDLETLHDLDDYDVDLDACSKYEIISTDSPDIVSRGRSAQTVTAKNLVFGAPLADSEQSTSFNRGTGISLSRNPSRALNFDESFEFQSPAAKSSKKIPRLSDTPNRATNETPKKNALRHNRSDSSIGSMSNASPPFGSQKSEDSEKTPVSRNRLRLLFPSESTNSLESGFVSETDDAFLFETDSYSSPKIPNLCPKLGSVDDENSPKVANFGDLLSGRIKSNVNEKMEFDATPKVLLRSMSLTTDNALDKVRMSLFKSSLQSPSERIRGFKRPEPPVLEDSLVKRRKPGLEPRPVLHRALSENCAGIKNALARSASNPDLTGDFSRPCALPLTGGRHQDLKSISRDTLARLMEGEFHKTVASYQIVDCRYPYEFEGGHVKGAINLYTNQHMIELLHQPPAITNENSCIPALEGPTTMEDDRRHIIIFHCEFSQERGPKLSRFLRGSDRAANKDRYPSLTFPEVYLLHDGYSSFHTNYPHHCSPAGYTPMLHPQYKTELARHRSTSNVPLTKSTSVDGVALKKSRSRLLM